MPTQCGLIATLMSKGLGHVGRAVLAAFEDEPDNAFTTAELCLRVWPDCGDWPERTQRVAVLRAVKGLAARRPDLGITSWVWYGNDQITFYRRYRVLSYAMARLKGDNWRYRITKDELRARLAPGSREHSLTRPGGSWLLHTEIAIATRDGDHEKLAQLEAERERDLAAFSEALRGRSTSGGGGS